MARSLIVVEGYVDVIAMVTSGFAGAVAPLGTALTENQLALLWKMADEPILCFDGDTRRPEGGLARRRPRAAAAQTRKEPALCAAAGGAGPRRPRALRRARRDRGGDRRRARTCRRDLVARDRGRQFCHPRAPRRAGSADRRARQRHPRRGGAALLPPGSCRAPAAHLCARDRARRLRPRPIRAAARAANHPAASPRRGGAGRRPVRARTRAPRPRSPAAPTRRRARSSR